MLTVIDFRVILTSVPLEGGGSAGRVAYLGWVGLPTGAGSDAQGGVSESSPFCPPADGGRWRGSRNESAQFCADWVLFRVRRSHYHAPIGDAPLWVVGGSNPPRCADVRACVAVLRNTPSVEGKSARLKACLPSKDGGNVFQARTPFWGRLLGSTGDWVQDF